MARPLLLGVFVVGIGFAAVFLQAAGKFTLNSVSVNLPAGERQFPYGPGSDAISNNCLACHSADMVLYQPVLPRAQWDAEISKMCTAYKAPVGPKDIDAILRYLVSVSTGK